MYTCNNIIDLFRLCFRYFEHTRKPNHERIHAGGVDNILSDVSKREITGPVQWYHFGSRKGTLTTSNKRKLAASDSSAEEPLSIPTPETPAPATLDSLTLTVTVIQF